MKKMPIFKRAWHNVREFYATYNSLHRTHINAAVRVGSSFLMTLLNFKKIGTINIQKALAMKKSF